MPFLFLNKLYNRACFAELDEKCDINTHSFKTHNPKPAYKYFNFEIRRYFGLGFFASFIPGTKAYQARCIFSEALSNVESDLQQNISENYNKDFISRMFFRTKLYGFWKSIFTLSYLWEILWRYRIQANLISINNKISLKRLFSYFPIVNEICYVDADRQAHLHSDFLRQLANVVFNPVNGRSNSSTG
jgi:hypothetical protein